MTRPESLHDYPYYGRGYPYYGQHQHEHHGHRDGHHNHHNHSQHHHSQQQQSYPYPPQHHAFRSRGRPSSPVSSAGRSSPDSDTYSTYDSKSKMRWILSLGLLLPALAAIIGVTAWAVGAEVVIEAHRGSALKASEQAFRFSQGPRNLDWSAVESVDDSEEGNSVPSFDPKRESTPKVAAVKETGAKIQAAGSTETSAKEEDNNHEDTDDYDEDDGRGPKWETSSQSPPSTFSTSSSSTSTGTSESTPQPSSTTSITTTTTTTTESTLSYVFQAIKGQTLGGKKTETGQRFDTKTRLVDKEDDDRNEDDEGDDPEEQEVSSLEKNSSKDSSSTSSSTSSPKFNGSNIYFMNGVDTTSSSKAKDVEAAKKDKTPGDQVAEVINRLVAQRLSKNGVRPHIVVVAPVSDSSRKKLSTTSTPKPDDNGDDDEIEAAASKKNKKTSIASKKSKMSSKTTTTEEPEGKPSTSKPILSRDADTLLAAAQMLAARHKYISMRNDNEGEFEEESTKSADAPQTTTPFPTKSLNNGLQSFPHPHVFPGVNHPSMQHLHPQHRPLIHGHPLIHSRFPLPHPVSINGPPPGFNSYMKHIQSDRMGQTSQASHFTPTHILPPSSPSSSPGQMIQRPIHVNPTGLPPPGIGLNQVHVNGLPPPPVHMMHHHQGLHPHLHQIRFLQGQQQLRPGVIPSHPGQSLGSHPHQQFLPPPPGHHPGIMLPPPSGQSFQGNNNNQVNVQPTEAATEPTEESQVSANFGGQAAEGNPQKAVIQFHSNDPQAAESGANKGLTLHFGGGPVAGGGQLLTSPVGIFKTLLLPLLPKPRVNLNGKVVFGVVLEKGVGYGKEKPPHRAVKFRPSQLYSRH